MTLQSLEAKSNRLMAMANMQNCAIVNLSSLPESRLTFPRKTFADIQQPLSHKVMIAHQNHLFDTQKINQALSAETELGYLVASGRYWESVNHFDPEQLRKIDDIWNNSGNQNSLEFVLQN
jgi:hypothetical protein